MDLEITLTCSVCGNELSALQLPSGDVEVSRCDCSDDEIYKNGYDAGVADWQ